MKKHVIIAAATLSLLAGGAYAKPKPDIWSTGKDRWHAAVKDKECGGTCWKYEGTYPTRKQARAAAKRAIEERKANGVWGDGRTDGGLCGQPGVEC